MALGTIDEDPILHRLLARRSGCWHSDHIRDSGFFGGGIDRHCMIEETDLRIPSKEMLAAMEKMTSI